MLYTRGRTWSLLQFQWTSGQRFAGSKCYDLTKTFVRLLIDYLGLSQEKLFWEQGLYIVVRRINLAELSEWERLTIQYIDHIPSQSFPTLLYKRSPRFYENPIPVNKRNTKKSFQACHTGYSTFDDVKLINKDLLYEYRDIQGWWELGRRKPWH